MVSIPEVESGPRKHQILWGKSPQVSITGWSMRLRPTWSDFPVRSEARRSFAFSIECAARTKIVPRATCVVWPGDFGSLYALYSMPVTRPLAESMRTFDATAWVTRVTLSPVRVSVFSGLYLAWTGQMGTQLVLPSQRWPRSGEPTAPTGV